MAFDCDLFVIGAGSGGVRAARVAAGHGAKVIVAEEFRVGGTCVIRGCVPKKLLVYASRFADEFAVGGGLRLDRRAAALRLADSGRGERSRDRAPVGGLPRRPRLGGRDADRGARDGRRPPYVAIVGRAHDQRAPHPRRDRRAAGAAGRLSRARARDHLQRDLRPARLSAAPAGGRRRLYRGRIRLPVRQARRRGDAGHARRQRAQGLRRGHARGPARRAEARRRAAALRLSADALRAARRSAAGDAVRRRGGRRSTRRWSPPGGGRTPRGSASRRPGSRSTSPARWSSTTVRPRTSLRSTPSATSPIASI